MLTRVVFSAASTTVFTAEFENFCLVKKKTADQTSAFRKNVYRCSCY